MEITYFGHSSFRLRGKTATVVTDPYGEAAGKFPKEVEADIATVSHGHDDHNATKLLSSSFIVDGAGEYEVKGVSVIGVHTWHDDKNGIERGANTIYVIEMDGLRIAHLGDLGHKLNEDQLEEMGPIDVAMVPVGGVYTIDPKRAVEVVRQVDPWVVVPMHYQQAGLDPQTFGKLVGVEEFLKEMGKSGIEPTAKLVISTDRLPSELQVVVLERRV